jgi:hypothetical protein
MKWKASTDGAVSLYSSIPRTWYGSPCRRLCGGYSRCRAWNYRPPEAKTAGVPQDSGLRALWPKELAWEQLDATKEMQSKAKRI